MPIMKKKKEEKKPGRKKKIIKESIENRIFKKAKKEAESAVRNWKALGRTEGMLRDILASAGASEEQIEKIMRLKSEGKLTDDFLTGVLAGLKYQRVKAENRTLKKIEAWDEKVKEIKERREERKREKMKEKEKKGASEVTWVETKESRALLESSLNRIILIMIIIIIILALVTGFIGG